MKRKKHLKYSRNKGLVLYGVLKEDPSKKDLIPENPTPAEKLAAYEVLAVTSSVKEAREVLDKIIYLNHIEHFNLWCSCHDQVPAFREQSWKKYKRDVIGKKDYIEEFSNYNILALTYGINDIAAILRVLYKCRPLLMDYEKPAELHKYLQRHIDPETHLLSIPMYLFSLMQYDAVDGKILEQVFKLLQAFTPPEPQKEKIEDLDDLAK